MKNVMKKTIKIICIMINLINGFIQNLIFAPFYKLRSVAKV